MGRDINWYVIPSSIEHDNGKTICMKWEFQEDVDDIEEQVYSKVTGNSTEFHYDSSKESEIEGRFINQLLKHKKNVGDITHDYIYNEIHKDEWCPKCLLFARGFYNSPLLAATMNIGHSYSNPYWSSDWNIRDLHIGSSTTAFVKLFRNDNMYYEINSHDVKNAIEQVNNLGKPLRTTDKEACEETMMVLDFLALWTKNDSFRVIMQEEY